MLIELLNLLLLINVCEIIAPYYQNLNGVLEDHSSNV